MLNLYQIAQRHMPEEGILDMKYGRTAVSADSVSAVSVIRGLMRPEKKTGKLKK
jgi:hypothetical protein